MTHMNHDEPYPEAYLQGILKSIKTIAMVGASPDRTKFSYGVLRVLHETGYDMIPVNPTPGLTEIRGSGCTLHLLRSTGLSIWLRSFAAPKI
jgi:uncharacterized protein